MVIRKNFFFFVEFCEFIWSSWWFLNFFCYIIILMIVSLIVNKRLTKAGGSVMILS